MTTPKKKAPATVEAKAKTDAGLIVDILWDHPRWKTVRGVRPRIMRAAAATFAHLPASLQAKGLGGQVTILLTHDRAVHQLNRDYRGHDKTTNVLSFPSFDQKEWRRGHPGTFLGDIAVSYKYVVDEARREDKILLDHLTHLVIHGILHLFGFDHMKPAQARKMEQLEIAIMAALGLSDPYALPPATPARCPSARSRGRV